MTWEQLAKSIMGLHPEMQNQPVVFCDTDGNFYAEVGFGEFADRDELFRAGDPVLYSKLMEPNPLITTEEDIKGAQQ